MARKRTAEDEAADRAYALSVAAAMAASESEIVHRPSVKKKKKSIAMPNGRATAPPAKRGRPPNKQPRPLEPPRARATPVKAAVTPVKKEKLEVKYEPPVVEEEEEEDEEEEEEEEEESILEGEVHAGNDGDDEEGEEDEEEIAAPVVFQCGTCRSIFGDSYSFMCSNAELLLVTLSAVTNISVSPEAHTSRDGADRGSSFHELLCKQCQTVLGRQYLTTTRALDAIRSHYSFATTSIASYQLGYPQLSQVENGTSDTLPSMDDITQANAHCDEAVRVLSLDRKELLRLKEDMSKVQSLLVVVDERLHQLETQAEDSEQEEDEQPPPQPQHKPAATPTRRPVAGKWSPPY